MAPNKFEQHIKEELNKRELEPTSQAWEKIASMLDKTEKRKNTSYLWWGIAASFTGLLIISTIYLNSKKSDLKDNNTVVDVNKDSIELKEDTSNTPIENIEEIQITNTTIDNQDSIKVLVNKTKIEPIKRNNYSEKNEITEVTIVNPQLEIEKRKEGLSQEELVQQKIAEVISKVEYLERNKKTLTDFEVDSLIIQAQKEILQNKIFRKNQSFDAMALLNEVEDELNKPLKDQLFDLLKKGVFETKNAIAARNN